MHSSRTRPAEHVINDFVPAMFCFLGFSLRRSWRIFDFREGTTLPPFDGQERTQKSTWRFEGHVRPPPALPDAEVDVEEATRRMQASMTRAAVDLAATREGDDPDLMGTGAMARRDAGEVEEDELGWIVYAVV